MSPFAPTTGVPTKPMVCPSGNQFGIPNDSGDPPKLAATSCVGFEPSEPTIERPLVASVYTSRCPSGDHAGAVPGPIILGFEPSASATQMTPLLRTNGM